MFPLDENTWFILAFLLVGGGFAAVMAFWRGLSSRLVLALMVAALVWPWPIAIGMGLDHYTIGAAFYVGFWTAVAVAAGSIWGRVSRYAATGSLVLVVAIVPALAGGVFTLERQRVPNDSCATEARFRIADVTLTIPREAGARSVTAEGAPAQPWQGVYGAWAGAKPDVRALCRASAGGTEPLPLTHMWISFSWFRKQLENECAAGTASPDQCRAISETRLTVLQLYARPDGLPRPSLSHFNANRVETALAQGRRTGVHCNPTSRDQRHCTLWLDAAPGLLAVASAWLGPQSAQEDPIGDADILIRAWLAYLSGK